MTTFNGMIFDASGGAGVSGLATADGGTAIANNAVIRGDGATGIQGSLLAISDTGALTLGLSGTRLDPAIKMSGGVAGLYDDLGTGGVCFEFASGTSFSLTTDGVYKFLVDTNEVMLPVGTKFGWGNIGGVHDTGLERGAAGVVYVTDGLGNPGALRALSLVVDDVYGGDATGGAWTTTALSVYPGVIRLGASYDAGVDRAAAGVVMATNGSANIGALLAKAPAEVVVAGTGSPNVILETESGTVYNNTGAAENTVHTLPAASAGLVFVFINADNTYKTTINAVAGDYITIGGVGTSSSGGNAFSDTVYGEAITLHAVDSSNWVATSLIGAWSVA